MPLNEPFAVQDADVYILTFKSNNELQASEASLDALALKLLVLIDGKATVAEIRARAKISAGDGRFLKVMGELVRDGYADLATNQLTLSPDFIEFFSASPKKLSESALSQAESDVASGVSTLQRHGYYVRIAIKAAAQVESSGGESVLIVEDDEALAKFLRKYLELEGLVATTAGNRDEIVAGLRRQPPQRNPGWNRIATRCKRLTPPRRAKSRNCSITCAMLRPVSLSSGRAGCSRDGFMR